MEIWVPNAGLEAKIQEGELSESKIPAWIHEVS
jgi:hypothetical protein